MGKAIFFGLVVLLGISKLTESQSPELWTAMTEANQTFRANASFKLNITYQTTDKTSTTKTKTLQFLTNTTDQLKAENISDSAFVVHFVSNASQLNMSLTFQKDSTNYYLSELNVSFVLDSKNFPNATNKDAKVTASMVKTKMVFMTAIDNYYMCSLDTQLELNSSKSQNTWISIGGIQLEAFGPADSFSKSASKCFADNNMPAENNTWEITNEKGNLFGRIQSKIMVSVSYQQISEVEHVAKIPVPQLKSAGTGEKTLVTATFNIDGEDVVLKMNFTKSAAKAADEMYFLSGVTLTYNSTSKYFPNHPISDKMVTISNSSLHAYPTSVNHSYECLVESHLMIDTMTMELDDTKWQIFGVVPKTGFNEAEQCEAMQTTTPSPVTTPHPDPLEPTAYHWEATDESNNTCFFAAAGFQFRASYTKTGSKASMEIPFDFTNVTSKMTVSNCSDDVITVTLHQEKRQQMIEMTFTKLNNMTEYALTNVKLSTVLLNETFPNNTKMNALVMSDSNSIQLMKTPVNQTYNCSTETQVALTANDTTISDVYLRITGITLLQAFANNVTSKKTNKCFSDRTSPPASEGDWKLKTDKTNDTCARLKTMMTLEIKYYDVMNYLQTTTIELDGKNVMELSKTCGENVTTFLLDIDGMKMVNLSLTYSKIKPSYTGFAPHEDMDYVLSGASLSYMASSEYFPNHKDYHETVKYNQSNLMLYQTPVGSSYKCDVTDPLYVTNSSIDTSAIIGFSKTQWEAFEMKKNGSFSDAKVCAQDMTTIAPTTQPVTPPPYVPTDPGTEKFVISGKDNKTVCLLANFGLQLRNIYNTTNKTNVEIGFNFAKANTTITAECSGNTSVITFHLEKQQQLVKLTFMQDSAKKMTYLSSVTAQYNITKGVYPHAKISANQTTFDFTVDSLTSLSAPLKHAYNCSTETDIMIDMKSNVIVRILGVQLQAFDVMDKKFSNESKCFTDTLPTKSSTYMYTVNDTENENITCAMYKFAAMVNVTYKTMLGPMRSTMIPVANKTDYTGFCYTNTSIENSNVSALIVNEDGVSLHFLFNRTDEKSGVFNYEMFLVNVTYDVTSKYFPNHVLSGKSDRTVRNISKSFKSSSDHSYKCAQELSLNLSPLSHTDSYGTIKFKDVQVQPFGIKKSGGFSAAEDCATSSDKWSTTKIVVVSVIAGLIVLIIAGSTFFACRKCRKNRKASEYETI